MNLKFSLNRKSIAKKLTIVGKGLVLVMILPKLPLDSAE